MDLCEKTQLPFTTYNSLTEELLSIYLTEAKQVVYFNCQLLWLGPIETLFASPHLKCVESLSRKHLVRNLHPEIVRWKQQNLRKPPTYKTPLVSGSFVYLDRQKNWLSLLVALGMLQHKVSRYLSIGDALYLACEATESPINLYRFGGDITELFVGRVSHELFIGTPLFQISDCVFVKVPIWFLSSPPTKQLRLSSQKTWYYEKRLGSMVATESDAENLDTEIPFINLMNKMYS